MFHTLRMIKPTDNELEKQIWSETYLFRTPRWFCQEMTRYSQMNFLGIYIYTYTIPVLKGAGQDLQLNTIQPKNSCTCSNGFAIKLLT